MRDDIDLLVALNDLARHLDWPAAEVDVTARAVEQLRVRSSDTSDAEPGPPSLASAAASQRARRRNRVRWLAAAAAVIIGLVTAVPSTREAVADLLGVAGIHITQQGGPSVERTREAAGRLDLGREVSLEEAERLAPGPLPLPDGVGRPTAAYAGRPPGAVTLVWAADEDLPEVLDYEVGLLVTVFPADLGRPLGFIEKRTREGGYVDSVIIDGVPGFWLSGEPHEFLYVDEAGDVREDTIRLSGSALVWERDGMTYRIESALSRTATIRLAESLSD